MLAGHDAEPARLLRKFECEATDTLRKPDGTALSAKRYTIPKASCDDALNDKATLPVNEPDHEESMWTT